MENTFGENAGPFTNAHASFTINSPVGQVSGTKDMQQPPPYSFYNYGVCTTAGPPTPVTDGFCQNEFQDSTGSLQIDAKRGTAYLSYQATIQGSYRDSGDAQMGVLDFSVSCLPHGVGGSSAFSQNFLRSNGVQPLGPAVLTLTPSDATNEVGTSHTVTATADDSAGQPVQGATILFSVSGANSASGSCSTGADGTCTFSYTGHNTGGDAISAYADNNGNRTADSGEPTATAAKHWTPLPPASITLAPPDAVNAVSTQHTVTATVDNATSQPVSGVAVRFAVSGSVLTTGSCLTANDGTCSFTYQGPDFPGADLINAYADSNGNGSRDSGEPTATPATKAWVFPTTTQGQVTGGGQVLNAAGNDKIAFGFTAKSDQNGLKGECTLVDPSTSTKIKCLDVTALTASSGAATIYGDAQVNGQNQTYKIQVQDLGEPGAGKDTFSLRTSSGYQVGGVLQGGNIQVH